MSRAQREPVSLFDCALVPGSVVFTSAGKPLRWYPSMGSGPCKRRDIRPLSEKKPVADSPPFMPHQGKSQ